MYSIRRLRQTKNDLLSWLPATISTCSLPCARITLSYNCSLSIRNLSTTVTALPQLQQEALKAIPDLPSAPSSPAPYIVEEDLQKYIVPMYSRGWSMNFHTRELLIKDGKLMHEKFNAPQLSRRYAFERLGNASAFLKEVQDIVASEKHEPIVVFRNGGGKNTKVYIHTFTEHADGAPGLVDPNSARIGPGITLRDARLAILLEKKYIEGRSPFFYTPRGSPMSVDRLKKNQRLTDKRVIESLANSNCSAAPESQEITPLPVPPPPEDSDGVCTDEHFSNIITPMYTRGWNIVYNNHLGKNENGVDLKKLPVLVGFFRFTAYDDALAYTRDLISILETEEQVEGHMWIGAQSVIVQSLSQRSTPDLAVRDLRFAVLAEALFTERYSARARASRVPAMSYMAQPRSVEELKSHPASQLNQFHVRKAERVTRSHEKRKTARDTEELKIAQ